MAYKRVYTVFIKIFTVHSVGIIIFNPRVLSLFTVWKIIMFNMNYIELAFLINQLVKFNTFFILM